MSFDLKKDPKYSRSGIEPDLETENFKSINSLEKKIMLLEIKISSLEAEVAALKNPNS